MIPFTQYMRPNGRACHVHINRPQSVEAAAKLFLDAGGWFEIEHLSTGDVSMTACMIDKDREPFDAEIEVCPNGPEVIKCVDKLVARAVKLVA